MNIYQIILHSNTKLIYRESPFFSHTLHLIDLVNPTDYNIKSHHLYCLCTEPVTHHLHHLKEPLAVPTPTQAPEEFSLYKSQDDI